MKIVGLQPKNYVVIVMMTTSEWNTMRCMSGIPYDKRNEDVGAEFNLSITMETLQALHTLKGIKTDMTKLQTAFNKAMVPVDVVLGTVKAPQ